MNHIHDYRINQKKAGGKLFQENKTKTSINNRLNPENVLIKHEVRVVQRNHFVGFGGGLAGFFFIGFGVAFDPAMWESRRPQSMFGNPAMWDWHRAQLPQSMFGNPAMWDSLTQLPQSKFGNFAMWDSLRPQSMFGDPAMWEWFKPAFSSECAWPLYPLSESAFGVHKILVGTILWLFLLITFRILGKALGNHI